LGGTGFPTVDASLAVGWAIGQSGFMTAITFITGANKGLGYETARRLIELGQTVIIGARDAGRGQAAADRLGARFVPIDVTDDGSVDRAAADIEAHEGRIDTLINNAGIIGPRVAASELTGDDALVVFETNVISVVRVTTAFLPLLKRSDAPAVINVSSGMGSFALTHDPSRVESTIASPLYTASKSAVTMMTAQYAKAIPEVRFNAADPGYTATDLNGHSGHQTVAEGTDAIVALATEDASAGTGRFTDRLGPVAW
jgi:NAD(P)-dependent dehydrogenase (short-subunit alcohol dehydrogenase family)